LTPSKDEHGGSVHDPTDPVGRVPFNVLAMVAESEADLARMRTREGVKAGKAEGWLRGEQPKLAPGRKPPVELPRAGEHTTCPSRLRTDARDVAIVVTVPNEGAGSGPQGKGIVAVAP
jgi:DNA invertase Pin-like site-specific DNA recombinase